MWSTLEPPLVSPKEPIGNSSVTHRADLDDEQEFVMAETNLGLDENGATVEYDGPAGGWGSLKGIARVFGKEWATPGAVETLMRQNKPKGFMCVSCSWAKPADHHAFEFCENGAKATLWELTNSSMHPGLFRQA